MWQLQVFKVSLNGWTPLAQSSNYVYLQMLKRILWRTNPNSLRLRVKSVEL